ncbi:MAG: type II toxin-antitoxin system RelE/ParE family toxin [Halanaerobiales bacterium]|nr:type II toxin-antitoxin system RelE/ParE family toxin [Halanaerobiales bacterium]
MDDRYSVEITKSVEADLDKLKPHREMAVKKLLTLEENPVEKGSALKGNLKGLYSYKFNLPGSGAYRAIYYIKEEESVCLLILVGIRENIYAQAQRRYLSLKK